MRGSGTREERGEDAGSRAVAGRNAQVAEALNELAAIKGATGDRHRRLAYERAAAAVAKLPRDLDPDTPESELRKLPNVGSSIARKIREHLQTGRVRELEEARAGWPRDFEKFIRVEGVGARTAKRFRDTLGVDTVDDLMDAARRGRLEEAGFGRKLQDRILSDLPRVSEESPRWLLARAEPLGKHVESALAAHPKVKRAAYCGSARRGKPTVGDLDFVAVVDEDDRDEVAAFFAGLPDVSQVYQQGQKTLVRFAEGIDADLTLVDEGAWGTALMYFTGARDHTLELRTRAKSRGLLLNEHGLHRDGKRIAGATEDEVYAALGFAATPPPEIRENMGELEAAEDGAIPELVTLADLKGDLHVHTDASDGVASTDEMVLAAAAAGREYVALTDHTASTTIAGGRDAAFFRERLEEVTTHAWPIPVIVGAEVDILADGTLDLPDDVLEALDVVVASVHAKLRMAKPEMTERLVDALSTGFVDVLGHPTGRRIGSRDPSQWDFARVVDAAVTHDVALEVDGQPDRLDLDGALVKEARDAGARFAVDSDAHSVRELEENLRLAVLTARRGWLTSEDVVNAWDLADLQRWVGT